jgi:demethylmenaquinone methyltransferase/2-methoxy-6-polyprenyl-1,4-benzoquinol methylase
MRFERIASRYDLANAVVSLGQHRRWKRLLIRVLNPRPGETLLDAGTGTGDLALLAARTGASVVGVDVSPKMLEVAAQRVVRSPTRILGRRVAGERDIAQAGRTIRLIRGDVSQLPLGNGSVTAVASAFVLRHLPDLTQVFAEFRRVLAPGGRVTVLEFGQPALRLRPIYDAFSVTMIPLVGGLLTGDRDAYEFLVRSIRTCPEPAQVAGIMARAGFTRVRWQAIDLGVAVLYAGSTE